MQPVGEADGGEAPDIALPGAPINLEDEAVGPGLVFRGLCWRPPGARGTSAAPPSAGMHIGMLIGMVILRLTSHTTPCIWDGDRLSNNPLPRRPPPRPRLELPESPMTLVLPCTPRPSPYA
eukprot:CAMPEP_0174749422 /NCGR_PEP_ID=MMETSP1094-20130205/95689_1 /TAXON_ID=156173 /ORGANISM="Chrysochromulina brevifilum, Strain UTEX LB 985" /LENGTH=120 /DNA_ID=CAMNT_0015954631 /DNA_START=301 /DNA_END=660 /DNA_ORIENTATION=+